MTRPTLAAARVELRLACRDARRHVGRSVLVALMVFIPVLGVTGIDVLVRTQSPSPAEQLDRTMGHADALLTVYGGPVTQDESGRNFSTSSDAAPPPRAAAEPLLAAALPTGSRLLPWSTGQVTVRTSDLAAHVDATELAYADPTARGILWPQTGRAPRSDSEVAVSAHLLARLHLHLGDRLTVGDSGRSVTVVGTALNPQWTNEDAVVGRAGALLPPDPAAGSGAKLQWLADTPGPVTDPAIGPLNARGIVVQSRVLADRGPHDSGTNSTTVGMIVVVAGLAALEVVLLAGAAFAVGARRQAHDLALLAATGAERRHVMGVLVAAGLVLGAAGAAAGLAGGILGGWALGPVMENLTHSAPGSLDLHPLDLLAIAGLGALAGVLAAVVPARAAARQDVVAALTGRRGQAAPSRRVPLAGLAMVAAGSALSAASAGRHARFNLILVGAVLAELGWVVCAPSLVSALARLGRWLPLTPRLTVREAARHRGRSGPAVAAIMAAVAGSMAVSTYIVSDLAQRARDYTPELRMGQARLSLSSGGTPDAAVIAAARAALPSRAAGIARQPACGQSGCTSLWLQPPPDKRCPTLPDGGRDRTDPRCAITEVTQGVDYTPQVVVGGAELVAAVLGHPDPSAAAALAAGHAVVTDPLAVEHGTAWLQVSRESEANPGPPPDTEVPAYAVSVAGGSPFSMILPPSLAARLHVDTQPAFALIDTSRMPTAAEQDRAASAVEAAGGDADQLYVERGFPDQGYTPGLVALALGSAVITLGATAITTGLSAAESRPDLATLGAVGGSPWLRRRLAAAQAALVAGLGTVVGVAAGLLPAAALLSAHGGTPLVLPWSTMAATVLGVPILAFVLVGLLTRARLPVERRAA